jgi:predicted metal-dependent phosphoesterase TrpH
MVSWKHGILTRAKFDHHVHTSRHSPDSVIEPAELIGRAKEAGLDGVVITEHDYQWRPDELADLRRQAGGLVVLAGVEVSAMEGHFLVYGLPDLSELSPGIDLESLLVVVRRHEAAIVAAHPFRWEQDFNRILADHGPCFDAVELVSNNVTPATRRLTARAASEHRLATTGSSDGHEPGVVGCYFTELPGEVRTIADFVAGLRARASRPRHNPGLRLASGPVD